MEALKPYPKYKPSGIEWIGDIPEHWEVKKLKYVLGYVKGYAFKTDYFKTEGVPVVKASDIKKFTIRPGKDFIENDEAYKFDSVKLNEGDIVISTVGSTPDVINSAVGQIAKVPASFDGSLLNQNTVRFYSLSNSFYLNPFLFYLLASNPYRKYLDLFSHGTANQASLNIEDMLSFFAPFPSIKEQKEIVTWIDTQTAQIDKLISNKQQLIELLKEERTAIINHAVTKGINPKAPLKPSGIEWLGDIPKHWEVKKLSHGFELIGSGTTPTAGKEEYYFNGTHNWLQTGDLNDGVVENTSKKVTDLAIKDFSSLRVYDKGSLVIAMYGATIGKVCILDIPTTTNQACCVLSKPLSFQSKFVFYWFIANKNYIISRAYGGGQPNISQELIRSLRITCPSKEEQLIICEYLDSQTSKIDTTISKIEQEINLLQEYRTALISEVVTGKVMVV